MQNKMLLNVLLLVGAVGIFGGCAKTVTCKAPDNAELRVSVLEDSYDPMIVTERWNPFIGGWYTGDVVSSQEALGLLPDGNVITATMTAPGLFNLFGSKRIILNGDKDTVSLGEDTYKCNNDLNTLTTLVRKINQAKIDDRNRGMKADIESGRYY